MGKYKNKKKIDGLEQDDNDEGKEEDAGVQNIYNKVLFENQNQAEIEYSNQILDKEMKLLKQ